MPESILVARALLVCTVIVALPFGGCSSGGGAAAPASRTRIILTDPTAFLATLGRAQSGDTLLLQMGQYPAFSVNKGIRIVGQPGVSVLASGGSPAITVGGLPAGQTLVIVSVAVETAPAGTAARIEVSDSQGSILLDGITGGASYRLTNCAQAALTNCDGQLSASACEQLALTRCRLSGHTGPAFSPAMTLAGGTVFVTDGAIAGGSATGSTNAAAVRMTGTELVLTTVDGLTVGPGPLQSPAGNTVSPIEADTTSSVRADPGVAFDTAGGVAIVSGGGTFTAEPLAGAIAIVDPVLRIVTIGLRVPAGGEVSWVISDASPASRLSHIPGTFWINPSDHVLLTRSMPGRITLVLRIPPALTRGAPLAIQGVRLEPDLHATAPAVLAF